MTSQTIGNILPNSFEFNFFQQLKRNEIYEPSVYNKPEPNIPQKAPQSQSQTDLLSFNKIIHIGNPVLEKIPFENIKSRPLFDYQNGRNLSILNTLKENSKRDYPDVISGYQRRQLGTLL